MTMTELLAATLVDLGVDPTTEAGRKLAIALALRLGQAADMERKRVEAGCVQTCTQTAEAYEAAAAALPRRMAQKGQRMIERATGAHLCAASIRRARTRSSDDSITA